jgi:tRNA-binding protein
MPVITYEDFAKIDVRLGRIVRVKLVIDFGAEVGIRRSSAQLAARYRPEELLGLSIVAVVNCPVKQIGPTRSEVLVLGVPDGKGGVVLLGPDRPAPLGGRMF